MTAIHDRGFAGWTDELVREEIEARFGEPVDVKGRISSKTLVPLRRVVHDPRSTSRRQSCGP